MGTAAIQSMRRSGFHAMVRARGRRSRQRTTTLTSLSGHDDHLGDLVAVEVGLDAARLEAQPLELVPRRARGSVHPVADLAVHLADELERLRLEHVGVGVGPRLLPHAPAGEQLVGLGPQVRGEREHQRRRGRGREPAGLRIGVRIAVDLVEQLDDRGQRGVECPAVGRVAGDLVDRPVRLADDLQRVALGARRLIGGFRVALRRRRARRPGATAGTGAVDTRRRCRSPTMPHPGRRDR